MFSRFAFGFGYLVILLAVGVLAIGLHFMSGTVPAYSGSASVAGISGTVDIDRDDYAIPHIHAATEHDAYFGLGYAEAQDRLFQMELERRLGAGRLSELFGAKAVKLDEWSRTIGFARIADQMWRKAAPHARDVLTAYVAGINAYLAEHPTKLGFTFDALRLIPERWRPQDCLAIGRLMSWEMNFSALADAAFGDFSLTLDSAHLHSLFPYYPDDGATVLGGGNASTFVSNYLTGPPPVARTIARPAPALPVVAPVPKALPVAPSVVKATAIKKSTATAQSKSTTKPAKSSAKPNGKPPAKPSGNSSPKPSAPPFKPGVNPPKPHLPKPLQPIGARLTRGTEFTTLFEAATAFDSMLSATIGAPIGGGSNTFAVSGSRTMDRAPLLENDTHLQLESPSRWYLAHLISDDGMNVAGFLIPGLPVILAGRTPSLAWGVTNGMADECDYFIEKLDSTGTKYILPNGKSQAFVVFTDTIRVRDSESVNEASDEMSYEPAHPHAMTKVPFTVRMSIHGSILTDMHPDAMSKAYQGDARAGGIPDSSIFLRANRPVAMMWNGSYALSDEIAGFLELPHQTSAVDAAKEMNSFATPCLNLCLADTKGNIVYRYIGRLPRRAGTDARQLLPRDGTNPADQWMGFYSSSELPYQANPTRGFIVSANNPPGSTNIPFGLNWEPSARADRISELLQERPRVDETYLQSIQTDVISPYDLRRILPYLLTLYPDPNPPSIAPDSISAFRRDSMELYWKEDSLAHHTSMTDSAFALVHQKDSIVLLSRRPKRDTTIHEANVDPFTAQVLSYLRNWDGGMRADEIAPAIYSVFLNRLIVNTFSERFPSLANAREFLALENIPFVTLANILPDSANVWWHSAALNGRDATIQLSFRESLRILAHTFGPDLRTWQWGKLHTLTFRHPFDKGGGTIARLVDVLAGPMPGGPTTVLQASYYLWEPANLNANAHASGYEMQVGPSMRMIANLRNDSFLVVLPTGNSEAIFGDHYSDMLSLYRSGALIRIPLDATMTPGANVKRFELRPAAS